MSSNADVVVVGGAQGRGTAKSSGGSATDGFIVSTDPAFAYLKVWGDTNQDGISQASELLTLAETSITSISNDLSILGTVSGPQAGQVINSNRVALSSAFTQNGTTRTVGAIDLEANNFSAQFPTQVVDPTGNPLAITAQARAMPQMSKAGMVRDMRTVANSKGSRLPA